MHFPEFKFTEESVLVTAAKLALCDLGYGREARYVWAKTALSLIADATDT